MLVEDRLYVGVGSSLLSMDLSKHEVLWRFKTGGEIESSPALSGRTLYVGSGDGDLYALDSLTGAKLWEISTGDRITASPAVADGTVYIGSHNGNFYAIK